MPTTSTPLPRPEKDGRKRWGRLRTCRYRHRGVTGLHTWPPAPVGSVSIAESILGGLRLRPHGSILALPPPRPRLVASPVRLRSSGSYGGTEGLLEQLSARRGEKEK